jgi:hypothetical protein
VCAAYDIKNDNFEIKLPISKNIELLNFEDT